jgi:tetratricopeptide (TPR) repeat protein
MSSTPNESLTADVLRKLRQAADCQRRGELSWARRLYAEVLELRPGQFDALHMLGVIELMSGRFATAYRNRSQALSQLGRLEESLADIDCALTLKARWPDLHCERGYLLLRLRRPEPALVSFQAAIDQDPGLAEAQNGKGNALCELGRWPEAIASYERVLALRPTHAGELANCAVALNALEHYPAAIAYWSRALSLDPGNHGLRAQRCFARLRICSWPELHTDVAALHADVARGAAVCDPFQMLALTDSCALQRAAAEQWVRATYPADAALGPIATPAPRQRTETRGQSARRPAFRHRAVHAAPRDRLPQHARAASARPAAGNARHRRTFDQAT